MKCILSCSLLGGWSDEASIALIVCTECALFADSLAHSHTHGKNVKGNGPSFAHHDEPGNGMENRWSEMVIHCLISENRPLSRRGRKVQ